MLRRITMMSLVATILIGGAVAAQAPADAPAGATGLCRDGSYWSGATKQGACRGHKGVKDWYASKSTPGSAGAPAAPPVAAGAAPSPAVPAPAPPAAATRGAPSPALTQAPGGGPDQVWVNTGTKVYHCPSDRWYGKTKHGAYMTEADAVAKGNRADHGKACAK